MRKLTLTSAVPAVVLALGLTLAGCSAGDEMSGDEAPMSQETSTGQDDQSMTDEQMDKQDDAGMMAAKMSGMFEGLNGKKVAGTVTVEDGSLMLSDFSSDEGPDLHVYLTNGTDEAAVTAGKMIDAVAFDEASQSFMLDGVDVSKYSHVVIHCDKAKAVFGAAALS